RVAGYNLYQITFFDLQFGRLYMLFLFHDYNTSGANDTIFINCFSRNSLATGPKIRVPLGSSWLFNKTAALSSKRMYEPSLRRISFLVLTTTAFETVPFLMLPDGRALFTVTTILSPIEAYLLPVPPNTRITKTSLAPLLSATFNLDSCCTILFSPFYYLNQTPVLIFAKRAGFHDCYCIAYATGVGFVMSHKLCGFLYELTVYRVF